MTVVDVDADVDADAYTIALVEVEFVIDSDVHVLMFTGVELGDSIVDPDNEIFFINYF